MSGEILGGGAMNRQTSILKLHAVRQGLPGFDDEIRFWVAMFPRFHPGGEGPARPETHSDVQTPPSHGSHSPDFRHAEPSGQGFRCPTMQRLIVASQIRRWSQSPSELHPIGR